MMAKSKYCKIEYTTFIWKVKNPFFFYGSSMRSRSFSIDSDGVTRYFLNLISEDCEDCHHISIRLEKDKLDCEPTRIDFNLKASVTSSNIEGLDEYYYLEHFSSLENYLTVFQKTIPIIEDIDCYYNNVLTIHLQIEPDCDYLQVDNLWACNWMDLETLSSDLSRTFYSKRYCDLTIVDHDGISVNLHKAICDTRYPSLMEILNLPEDSQRNSTSYSDINLDATNDLWQYLYSGKINIANTHIGLHELLKRAELFHLQQLLYPIPRIIHASTSVPLKHGTFLWKITNLSYIENDMYLTYDFCCDSLLEWTKLRIIFRTRQNVNEERCIAFTMRRTEQDTKLLMICKIALVGEEEYVRLYLVNFYSKKEFVISSFITMKQIVENKNCFVLDDTLKIRFEILLSNLKETSEYESTRYLEIERDIFASNAMNLWSLRKDVASLYLNSRSSDITIQTRKSLIPAHKVIVSARSQVFSRILQDEIESSIIVMTNYDEEIVMDILSYIYRGEVNTENKSCEWAIKLYMAAQEYQLTLLKDKCASYIETFFDKNNVCRIVEMADEYRDSGLQDGIEKFVCAHFYEVLETSGWQKLMKERYYLVARFINAVSE